MHWNQTFNMLAGELEQSNHGPWPYAETDLAVIIENSDVEQKIKQHYEEGPGKHYIRESGSWILEQDGSSNETFGRFIFTDAMYGEVNHLTGKIITLIPQ